MGGGVRIWAHINITFLFISELIGIDDDYRKLIDGHLLTCKTINLDDQPGIPGMLWAIWSTSLSIWNDNNQYVTINITIGGQRSYTESEIIFSSLTKGCSTVRECALIEESKNIAGTMCSWRCSCEGNPCSLQLKVSLGYY